MERVERRVLSLCWCILTCLVTLLSMLNKGRGTQRATSSSRRVRIHGSSTDIFGRTTSQSSTLNPKHIRLHKEQEKKQETDRLRCELAGARG
jgi:hypothetical protein